MRLEGSRRGLLGQYVDALALAVERNGAVNQREQGIVFCALHITAGEKARSTLTDQDPAGADRLAAVDFDAQPLAVRLAAVANGTLTLFMCHVIASPMSSLENRRAEGRRLPL